MIEHNHLPIQCEELSLVKDKISNSYSMKEIIEYIAASEAILTNSYHMAYWGILMGKKTVVVDKFSTKFDYFKYKPEFISSEQENNRRIIRQSDLDEALKNARIYPGALAEARAMNLRFFERAADIIDKQGIEKNKNWQSLYELNLQALWYPQSRISQIDNLYSHYNELYAKLEELNWAAQIRRSRLFKIAKKFRRFLG
ncbi:MAG: hypothetical protein IJD04_08335 [Desulfovibrionaceae bacterium]|nr:hypothetical protein [Desulfovibrionaceae bacterium]